MGALSDLEKALELAPITLDERGSGFDVQRPHSPQEKQKLSKSFEQYTTSELAKIYQTYTKWIADRK